METIKELMQGRTTLIVTHRLATIHGVDRIVVLENGRIVVSDKPGIGLDLDYEIAKAHQYPGTTWFA